MKLNLPLVQVVPQGLPHQEYPKEGKSHVSY